jgi:GNAT superfamily N-acetyltransferase
MLLFTPSKQYFSRLSVCKLTVQDVGLLGIAAAWAEKKWGYIAAVGRSRELTHAERIEARLKLIAELLHEPHGFYMVMMNVLGIDQPVGMFSLRAWSDKSNVASLTAPADSVLDRDEHLSQLRSHLQSVVEVDYVYIEESMRGLGLGSTIVKRAKDIAKRDGKNTMILDTLNPALNRFYQAQGATVLLESAYHSIPTEKLSINLNAVEASSSSSSQAAVVLSRRRAQN